MEGPLAPVQVPQKEARPLRLAQPRAQAPKNLRFVGVCFGLFKVLFSVVQLFGVRFLPISFQIIVLQLLL